MSSFSFDPTRIAKRLGEIRTSRGLSAERMAQQLADVGYEVSYVTVLAYESPEGTKKVPATYCLAVARVYGLPIAYVLGDTDDPRPPAPPTLSQAAIEELERQVERVRTTLQAVRQPGVLPEPAPEVPPRSERKPEGSE